MGSPTNTLGFWFRSGRGGPFSGRGLLTFATEAAAEAVVQQNAVHVKGQPVLLQMGGAPHPCRLPPPPCLGSQ